MLKILDLLSKKNRLILHFAICSLGLLGIVRLFANIVTPLIFNNEIVFNNWASSFYNVNKPPELIRYIFSIIILFLYFFLIGVFFNNKKLYSYISNKTYIFLEKNLFFTLFITLNVVLNTSILLSNGVSFFNRFYGFFLISTTWITIIISPFLKIIDPITSNFYKNKKLIYYLVLIIVVSQFIHMFLPFTFYKLKILNEYFDLPDQTVMDGKFINNNSFINNNNLLGQIKFDINLNSDYYDKYHCFSLSLNTKIQEFANNSNNKFYVDKNNNRLCSYYPITYTEKLILSSLIDNNEEKDNLKKEFNLNLYNGNYLDNKKYDKNIKNFLDKNKFLLHWQTLNRFVIHHHNHILGPINELALGKNIKYIYAQYGSIPILVLKQLLEWTGGINYQNYFRVYYSFYYLYYALFALIVYLIFKRIDYLAITTILSVSALNWIGFGFIFLGPGSNPIRHLFDILVLFFFSKYLNKNNFLYILLSYFFTFLSILANREFGLFIFITLTLTLVIKYIQINNWKLILSKLLPLFPLGILGSAVYFYSKIGPDFMSKYFLYGFLGFPLVKLTFFLILFSFVICYILIFIKYGQVTHPSKYIFLFLFLYSQGLLIYYIWGGIDHFTSLAPIFILCIIALFNFLRFSNTFVKNETNKIVSFLFILSLIIYVPSIYNYYFSKSNFSYISFYKYDQVFKNHRIYQWNFDTAKFISTMDPEYFENGVKLIKKYNPGNDVYIISKYDNILPFLAKKYSAMPFFDLASFLITEGEVNKSIAIIKNNKPRFIFIDSDINRDYFSDIINPKIPIIGYLNQESVLRVKRLNLLKDVFNAIRSDYQPIDVGNLITVYKRK